MTIKRVQDMSINRVINGVTGKQSRYSAVTISSFPYYDTDPLYGSSIGQLASAGNLYNLSNTLYAGSLQSVSSNMHGDLNAFTHTVGLVTFRTFIADANDVSVFPSLVVGTKYGVAKCTGTGTLTYKNNLPVLVAGIGAGGGGGVNGGGGGGAGVFYSTSYDMKRLSNGLSFVAGAGATFGAAAYATGADSYGTGNGLGASTTVAAIDNSSNYIIYCEGGNPGASFGATNYLGDNGYYMAGPSSSGYNSYGTGGGGAGSNLASADSPPVNFYLGGAAYSTTVNSTWDSTTPFVSGNRKAYSGGNGSVTASYSNWRAGGGGGGTRTAGSAPTYASTLGYGTLSSYAVSGASGEQIGGLGGRGIPWCQVFSATNNGEIGVGGQGCHSFTLSSNPNAAAINSALTALLDSSGMSYGGQHIVIGGVDQTGSTSSKGMDGAANTGNGGGGNPVAPASTANWGAKSGSGCVWVVFKVIG